MDVKRTNLFLRPNNSRVLFRPFQPADPQRTLKIIARIMAMTDDQVASMMSDVLEQFHGRHLRLLQFFEKRFEQVKHHMLTDQPVSEKRRYLIGAYFSQEYSLESAALFNPSLVWHPDQTGVPSGARRFILSLRATGEGHLSSITFRSGMIDAQNTISLDKASRFVTMPDVEPNVAYAKHLFLRKLVELGLSNGFIERTFATLDESFTLVELQENIRIALRQNRPRQQEWEPIAQSVLALARSNYEVRYQADQDLSERVIFPFAPSETNGIEDARFVQFQEEDRIVYYAPYTAFDGKVTLPQLLETEDFLRFKIATLNGPEVRNKGLALFPRKIHGQYAMLSRQDGENIFLMYSDMLHFWYTKEVLIKPTYPWEFVQVGNCGSPIETDAGWLVLSHGVGPMRKYSIGAFLLDLEDPTKVIGRLAEPLLSPNEAEREGYVPNVVYSCGAVVHGGELVIPYAMSDYASTFATIPLDNVLRAMRYC